jgi:DNA-binding LacI/PurR family transcriptional regulator
VLDGHPGISIGCDNRAGGRAATEHLLALGRQGIAFVGSASANCPEFFDRYRGYVDALEARGLEAWPDLQVDATDSIEHVGFEATRHLIDTGVRFDAIFAASDLLAIGAIRALVESGRRVPDDVAVVGFDDIPIAAYVNPPLTTVMQDTKRAGELLVDTLIKHVRGEAIGNQLLPAKLVVRRSCGAK